MTVEMNSRVDRVCPKQGVHIAFSMMDIEMVILNGFACEKCGGLAYNAARNVAPYLRFPLSSETPSIGNIILSQDASEMIGDSIRIISKKHTRH